MHNKTKTDQELLRRFEPIIHFTKGEQFFPMCVDSYIRECSLWVQKPDQSPVCLVPDGELTIEKMVDIHPIDSSEVYFLRFIESHDLARLGVEAFKRRQFRQTDFHPGRGRLARVGYSSRFIDALFAITLFARGRVPGDTAIGAHLEYERVMAENEHYHYYGRVVRSGEWIVLQYWFFYAFNNWRSGFFGVNDHESDWEMICIYVYETNNGDIKPEWVAYASHDFHGDDLRRRWDDPEVKIIGEHPVIYAGAGSHASYFSKGEYMTEVVLPFLTPLAKLFDQNQRFWRKLLNRYQHEEFQESEQSDFNLFHIPFIDYARGDGLSIGHGQEKKWDLPCLLNPIPNWASQYRGLWGLYAHDPVSGEDAPAGPMYNRDGSVRAAWYDPIGWAGLDKLHPPNRVLIQTQARQAKIMVEQEKLLQAISEKHDELVGLNVELTSMEGLPHLKKLYHAHKEKITVLSTELNELNGELTANETLMETLNNYIRRLELGDKGPMRAHIHHAHAPASDVELRYDRLAEIWASVSMGLIMISFVALIFFTRLYTPEQSQLYIGVGLVVILSVMIFIEATFRKQLENLVTGLTNVIAFVGALVLLFKFSLEITEAIVLIIGGYIMWQNLKEFWR